MAQIKSLCIYCGSKAGTNPAHRALAVEVGAGVANRGWTLVYGGGGIGLMTLAADAALTAGGKVIGAIPTHLANSEIRHVGLSELILTDSMHERKAAMFDRADAFAVLPGGLGTLDEFFEILTWRQIGLHDKPVIVVDNDKYWAPLEQLVDQVIGEGFASESAHELFSVVDGAEAMFDALAAAPDPTIGPRPDRL